MKQLPADIAERIETLSQEGEALLAREDTEGARNKFADAIELIPEPAGEYSETTYLLGSIGDAFFFEEDFETAREAFADAIECPGGLGNPFLHLRLGQCAFELGDLKTASAELTRAYEADTEIFEEEDPRYLEYFNAKVKN